MATDRFDNEFVEYLPEQLEEGILYISMQYGTISHLCACGCGNESVTPLGPTDYQLTYDGETITLDHSIGNWNYPCRSHYLIQNGRVVWAGDWSDELIAAGRARDRQAKDTLFGELPDQATLDQPATSGGGRDQLPTNRLRVASWIARLLRRN